MIEKVGNFEVKFPAQNSIALKIQQFRKRSFDLDGSKGRNDRQNSLLDILLINHLKLTFQPNEPNPNPNKPYP